MDSRPFQFNLPAGAELPALTLVYWASSLWQLRLGKQRTSLLAISAELETAVCKALSARVGRAPLEWVGMLGSQSVEVIYSGSYFMGEVGSGLWVGPRHDPNPGVWLSRMIAINGQDVMVRALKGAYLVGNPWEPKP